MVDGFAGDTLVGAALRELARAAESRLAGGSRSRRRSRSPPVSAAAAPMRRPALTARERDASRAAAGRGPARRRRADRGDVPFFLADGPQLGSGDGSELERLDLPQDFWVVVLLPHDAGKSSTADVYAAFDTRHGVEGFAERREALVDGLAAVKRPRDLALCLRTTS
jgi:hypothetical protein